MVQRTTMSMGATSDVKPFKGTKGAKDAKESTFKTFFICKAFEAPCDIVICTNRSIYFFQLTRLLHASAPPVEPHLTRGEQLIFVEHLVSKLFVGWIVVAGIVKVALAAASTSTSILTRR